MDFGQDWSHLDLEVAPAPEQPRRARAGEPRRVNNLTLIDGKTFLATALAGDITPPSSTDVGLFFHDTRFLSHWEVLVNGHRAMVLSAATEQNLLSEVELTATNLAARDTLELPENTIHIHRQQLLAGRFFDRLTFRNFSLEPVVLAVEVAFDVDFMDVFQVRGMLRSVTGIYFQPQLRPDGVIFSYLGRDDLLRQTHIRFSPAPRELQARRARFELCVDPGAQTTLLSTVEGTLGEARPSEAPEHGAFAACLGRRRTSYQDWERATTRFESSDDLFNRCLQTAMSDFFALRVPLVSSSPGAAVPRCGPLPGGAGEIVAAGIPWFATIFGRDSLIAGYQTLMLHPHLAQETLRFLARNQGRKRDDWRDEEPGKILHEMREGEMTRAGEMPHSPYYGSVDATPLFLIVLDETYNWTGDDALLEELLPAARRALTWIEESGDLDGDGFVEYRCRSPQGLRNQGWKDSWDAYLSPDGAVPEAPLALCEVQGYCFDARYRMSRLLRVVGDAAGADRLRRQATELAHRFERQYWMPGAGYYAAALDAGKRPLPMLTSNAGHLLWSRIIGRERARQVVRRLMRADLFSGWGIRTLSSDEPTYNPLSYHRGSVWPHDNSLIAQGFAFYSSKQPLLRLWTGLYQAATFFSDQRLPELFVGVQREEFNRPVNYPVSCSPQAWASGAWFLLLTAALGLRPNAGRHELRIVNPVLPEWLQWLRLHQLRIGNSQVSLEFSRRATRTFCNVLDVQGDRLAISVDFTPGVY
ncbi:MAG: amylo-alpha-1,6-glucosidase [Terriglobales bacterium]